LLARGTGHAADVRLDDVQIVDVLRLALKVEQQETFELRAVDANKHRLLHGSSPGLQVNKGYDAKVRCPPLRLIMTFDGNGKS